jgi:hypothetical protein
MTVTATETPEFDAIVNDMVARHAAHRISIPGTRRIGGTELTSSCSCGWASGVTSGNLRPQWQAIDKHLIDDVLPQWQSGVCWCGRAMLLGPLGKWFHAQPGTLGHDAAPAEEKSR